MLRSIKRPRDEISANAPRLIQIQINPEKIGLVIGPGGKTIRRLQEETGAKIDIDDSGVVTLSSLEAAGAEAARDKIVAMTEGVQVGRIYEGRVTSIKDFGAFVEILPGKDGLVHISELSDGYVSQRDRRLPGRRPDAGQGHRGRRPGPGQAVAQGGPGRAGPGRRAAPAAPGPRRGGGAGRRPRGRGGGPPPPRRPRRRRRSRPGRLRRRPRRPAARPVAGPDPRSVVGRPCARRRSRTGGGSAESPVLETVRQPAEVSHGKPPSGTVSESPIELPADPSAPDRASPPRRSRPSGIVGASRRTRGHAGHGRRRTGNHAAAPRPVRRDLPARRRAGPRDPQPAVDALAEPRPPGRGLPEPRDPARPSGRSSGSSGCSTRSSGCTTSSRTSSGSPASRT